jgi:hypothetical protein
MFALMYSTAQLKWKSHFIEMEIILLGSEEENLQFKNHSTLQIILCLKTDVLFLIYYADSLLNHWYKWQYLFPVC